MDWGVYLGRSLFDVGVFEPPTNDPDPQPDVWSAMVVNCVRELGERGYHGRRVGAADPELELQVTDKPQVLGQIQVLGQQVWVRQ